MATALEAGQAYLKQVLAKLPEAQRASAEAIFNDAAAAAAVTEAGAGALRLEDYSRHKDTLTAEQQKAQDLYNQNKAWYDQNEADLKSIPQLQSELAAARTTPKPGETTAPPADAGKYITQEAGQDIVRELLGMTVVMPTLIAQHHAQFNEWLTRDQAAALVTDAQQYKRTVEAQYAITYGERLAAKATEQKAAYEEKLRLEGEQRFRAANPNMPYPVRSTGEIGSPLDSLAAKDRSGLPTPDALAAEYQQLVMSKGAST